ncbi:hypothetical protein MHYP_G00228050 [Metynnis hypsauchen]
MPRVSLIPGRRRLSSTRSETNQQDKLELKGDAFGLLSCLFVHSFVEFCDFGVLLETFGLLSPHIMTLEEVVGCDMADKKMETVSQALEELLVAAQRQDCLTVGVYESAKLMNVDPDSVVLCLLATDEEDEDDIALQIHFTLLQAFCCENDINILRVSGLRRLAQVLGEPSTVDVSGSTGGSSSNSNNGEPRDFHCILVTNPQCQPLKCQALQEVGNYCDESRCRNQWVPCLSLRER